MGVKSGPTVKPESSKKTLISRTKSNPFKKVGKWMRSITQNNADISSPYMRNETLPSVEEIEKEAEFCTVHYLSHLIHGLEIIGYKHPDETISNLAQNYYFGLVEKVLHLNPETKDQLETRLKDID